MSEVEVLPHAPRPQSCIGGIGVEGWLQQLEKVQGVAPAQDKMPPLSDRTVSMPTLHGGVPVRQYLNQALPHGEDHIPHQPVSRYKSQLGSEEDLFAPAGQWERARILSSPQVQPVRIATLPSVKNGWLPIQKRAVVCDIACHAPPLKDFTCQDQYNPPITTNVPECYIKYAGLTYTEGKERDQSSIQANCNDPKTRGSPAPASANIKQASNLASLKGDSPVGRERWKKGWEERSAAFPSNGIHSGDHNAVPRRHSPLHRNVSVTVCSRPTAPPAGMDILPTKPGFFTITGAAQRVPRSHASPLSSGAAAKLDEAGSVAHENPTASRPGEPTVRRRWVSGIKVTNVGRRPPEFRHSYTEGQGKDTASFPFCRSSGTPPAQPSARVEGSAGSANATPHLRRPRSCSLADVEDSGQKIYRSTLSLYLCRPSSGGASGGPARALSFAGAFRHSDPSLGGPPDPAAKQWSRESLKRADIGSGRDTASSQNTRLASTCQPGAGMYTWSSQQDVSTGQMLGLHPGQSQSQRSAAVTPRAASPIINLEERKIDAGRTGLSSFPESGTHQSAEAILALNAASVIANIKLQTQINKMAGLLSQQESKKLPNPGNEKVEDSGSCESGSPDAGVVRRASGTAGRKARPRPIHWQEPLSHQQDGNAAALTLKESLQLLRPDFIRRSQRRVKEVEQQAQKRRAQQRSVSQLETTPGTWRTCRTEPNPLSDNHSKLADRAIAGKEMLLRSKKANGSAPDTKRNKQEEKKRVVSQANRLRVAVFKKKLLDQVLRRT